MSEAGQSPVIAGGGGERGGVARQGAAGRAFYKLTGSGNDFIFFDERGAPESASAALRTPEAIVALCNRRNGVGADGVVFVEAADRAGVRIAYYNNDGSRPALCGNATLCTARLASLLGAVSAPEQPFVVATDAGRIEARVPAAGDPVIALGPVRNVEPDAAGVTLAPGERRIGYALAGVPHLVVLVDDVESVALDARGAALRAATSERPGGANVNWVARVGGQWRMRTFERGVEGETLACGTGAVASATLIARWTGAVGPITILASSGLPALVTPSDGSGETALLAGEGRLVFRGELAG